MSNTAVVNTKYQITIPKKIGAVASFVRPKARIIITIRDGYIVLKDDKKFKSEGEISKSILQTDNNQT